MVTLPLIPKAQSSLQKWVEKIPVKNQISINKKETMFAYFLWTILVGLSGL